MSNSNFKKLALMGMVGGALLAQSPIVASEGVNSMNLAGHNGCGAGSCGQRSSGRGYTADASMETQSMDSRQMDNSRPMDGKNMNVSGRRMMTESELMSQLNSNGKDLYRSLSPEGKALALRLASSEQFRDKVDAVREAQRQAATSKNSSMNKNY